MYVDASDSCNLLSVALSAPLGLGTPSAQWLIKSTQIECGSLSLAPVGCTQFLFGAAEGAVRTFNYAAGSHLANQDQNICIRSVRT